jgi:hypothetical protein
MANFRRSKPIYSHLEKVQRINLIRSDIFLLSCRNLLVIKRKTPRGVFLVAHSTHTYASVGGVGGGVCGCGGGTGFACFAIPVKAGGLAPAMQKYIPVYSCGNRCQR